MPLSSFRFNRAAESALLVVLALLGLALFAYRFGALQPSARFDIRVDRQEAFRIATAYAESLSSHTVDLRLESASFRTDNAWSAFLQTQVQETEGLLAHRPYAFWDLILKESQPEHLVRVRISPEGHIFSFRHDVGAEEAGAVIGSTDAHAIAESFFRREWDLDLSGWSLLDERVDQQAARSDHTLRWQREITDAPGSRMGLSMVIAGDQVRSWSRSVELSPEFQARFDPEEQLHTVFDLAIFVFVTLIWLAALILFALRFRSSEVGVRNGFYIVFALLLAYITYAFNSASYAVHGTLLEDNGALMSLIVYMGLGIQIFFTALGQFFVWNTGESFAREVWPAKLSSFDKLFAQRLFSRDVGSGILRGFAMGPIALGVWYLLMPIFSKGQWTILGNEDLLNYSALVPTVQPVAGALTTALLGVTYAHLFSLSVLRHWLKRTWPAVVITAVVFGALFSETTIILDRFRAILPAVASGLIAYLFFLRYDLWTVFCGMLVSGVLLRSAAYLVHPAFFSAGMISLAFLALILVLGVIAYTRGSVVSDASVTPAYVRFISERERLKLELDIARQAQLRMLPERVPRPTGLDIAAFSEPAREVGGDYYDFIEFEDGRLGIVVGDVSGKGMPAALYMTMLKGYLQSRSETDSSPLSVLAHVNRMFGQSSDRAMFATMVYCVLDVERGRMTFARAGHCPVLVYRESDGSVYVLQPPGIGIGLERTDLFERVTREETLDVRAGDVVVLYSDGLTEARDTNEEEFGTQRLLDLIRTTRGSAEEILHAIRRSHSAFVGLHEPHDDLTCVVVRLVP